MNYGELKTEVENISHRSDFSSDWDNWIELIEGTFARNLRASEMLVTSQLTESERDATYDEIYDLPSDFLEARMVKTTGANGRPIKPVGLEALYMYKRDTRVWGYVITGTANVPQIAFIGTPATDSEFDLIYFAKQSLDVGNDSNTTELLTNHAELYLHGLLFYAYQKSQDLELAQTHADQLLEAITTINEQTGRMLGGSVARAAYNLGNNIVRGY